MEFADVNQIDRATWRKYLFYLDLVVFAVFALALVYLVRHTWLAGEAFANDAFSTANRLQWQVATDVAFLVGALSWIVYRFFRNQYLVLTRRF